mmetsp:Transcript_21531/g.59727  ORF Transcript_21531/g.59727 Transcript_21531/m.59727 type:complete len:200 (+) Transcript_21531:420-1019(+)
MTAGRRSRAARACAVASGPASPSDGSAAPEGASQGEVDGLCGGDGGGEGEGRCVAPAPCAKRHAEAKRGAQVIQRTQALALAPVPALVLLPGCNGCSIIASSSASVHPFCTTPAMPPAPPVVSPAPHVLVVALACVIAAAAPAGRGAGTAGTAGATSAGSPATSRSESGAAAAGARLTKGARPKLAVLVEAIPARQRTS